MPIHQEERRALKSTSEVDVRLKPGDGAPSHSSESCSVVHEAKMSRLPGDKKYTDCPCCAAPQSVCISARLT